MKNKFVKTFIYANLVVLFCTANFALAKDLTNLALIKTTAVKFLLAMFGVVIFSILLTVGLSIYNRFFVASQIRDYKLNKVSLRSPMDKDDAILMFITKNRLKD